MKIEFKDIVFVTLILILLAFWFLTLFLFDSPLLSISLLWIGMILLSIVYYYVYKHKKRNMKILKIRFLVSAVPIYPILAYCVYCLSSGEGLPRELRILPVFVVFTMLMLNAIVVYVFDRKNRTYEVKPES